MNVTIGITSLTSNPTTLVSGRQTWPWQKVAQNLATPCKFSHHKSHESISILGNR